MIRILVLLGSMDREAREQIEPQILTDGVTTEIVFLMQRVSL